MTMHNEYDANIALQRKTTYRQNYVPAKAESSSWLRAAASLIIMCAAGAGFAWIIIQVLTH